MKKFFKAKFFVVLAILMLPMLVLTACEQTNYFVVTVSISDDNRGNVRPNQSRLAEGSEHTISATETEGEFVCWVKDSITIVSTEKDYTFTVNAQTAGNYTGVFTQSDPEMMMYAAMTKISVYEPSSATSSQVTVTVEMASATSHDIRRQIYSGTLPNSRDVASDIFDNKVFSFTNDDQFDFFITVSYTENGTPAIKDYTLSLHNEFSDGQKSVTGGNSVVTLSFEKLSKELAAKSKTNKTKN